MSNSNNMMSREFMNKNSEFTQITGQEMLPEWAYDVNGEIFFRIGRAMQQLIDTNPNFNEDLQLVSLTKDSEHEDDYFLYQAVFTQKNEDEKNEYIILLYHDEWKREEVNFGSFELGRYNISTPEHAVRKVFERMYWGASAHSRAWYDVVSREYENLDKKDKAFEEIDNDER